MYDNSKVLGNYDELYARLQNLYAENYATISIRAKGSHLKSIIAGLHVANDGA